MKDPIENKVNRWVSQGEDKYSDINLRINHLDEWLFSDYEPCLGPEANFLTRLNGWLENVNNEDDQKTLFELVPKLFYVGRSELNILYREAYKTIFAGWLIDQTNVDFLQQDVLQILNEAIQETWFCPLTDSLRINQFYHINNIVGKHDFRPDWRSLVKFGDKELIKSYIIEENIKRIVLLEDFIGNGGQVSKAVIFAAKHLPDIPILVIPLIICPQGIKNATSLESEYSHIKISPVLSLTEDLFISEDFTKIEEDFAKKIHHLLIDTYERVSCSDIIDDEIDPFGPFGWRRTGGLIVMHTNTPNNTIPLIHNYSRTWNPLFKRHKRI